MTGRDGIPVIIDPIILQNRGYMAKFNLKKWRVICIYDPNRAVKTLYKVVSTYFVICCLAPRTEGDTPISLKRLADKVREMGRILKESNVKAYEQFESMVMEARKIWTKTKT